MYWRRLETRDWNHKLMFTMFTVGMNQERSRFRYNRRSRPLVASSDNAALRQQRNQRETKPKHVKRPFEVKALKHSHVLQPWEEKTKENEKRSKTMSKTSLVPIWAEQNRCPKYAIKRSHAVPWSTDTSGLCTGWRRTAGPGRRDGRRQHLHRRPRRRHQHRHRHRQLSGLRGREEEAG